MRIAAIVEYDGSNFSGWQWQDCAPSVQEAVEKALSQVADVPIRVTTAGRTDAGVHACAQVIHFDTGVQRSNHAWMRGANSNLPDSVALLWASAVDPEFHARFAATGREYHYVILNRSVRPTYLTKRVPTNTGRWMWRACRPPRNISPARTTSPRSAPCSARRKAQSVRCANLA